MLALQVVIISPTAAAAKLKWLVDPRIVVVLLPLKIDLLPE